MFNVCSKNRLLSLCKKTSNLNTNNFILLATVGPQHESSECMILIFKVSFNSETSKYKLRYKKCFSGDGSNKSKNLVPQKTY